VVKFNFSAKKSLDTPHQRLFSHLIRIGRRQYIPHIKGEIQFQSEEGNGTKITVQLPAAS
jgi:signal transduction histidine kinase